MIHLQLNSRETNMLLHRKVYLQGEIGGQRQRRGDFFFYIWVEKWEEPLNWQAMSLSGRGGGNE